MWHKCTQGIYFVIMIVITWINIYQNVIIIRYSILFLLTYEENIGVVTLY